MSSSPVRSSTHAAKPPAHRSAHAETCCGFPYIVRTLPAGPSMLLIYGLATARRLSYHNLTLTPSKIAACQHSIRSATDTSSTLAKLGQYPDVDHLQPKRIQYRNPISCNPAASSSWTIHPINISPETRHGFHFFSHSRSVTQHFSPVARTRAGTRMKHA